MTVLDQYSASIKHLCKTYKVSALHAFGSIVENSFSKDSDIDLIVGFKTIPIEKYADNYFALKFALEDLFNRPVDLLEQKALKNPYFLESINNKKVLVYGS